MYNELKPCPFCGGEAELYQSYCGYYQIECHQCSARSCTGSRKRERNKQLEYAFDNRNKIKDYNA